MHGKKTVLICGCGISGRAAASLAAVNGYEIILADNKSGPEINALAETLKTMTGVQVMDGWTEEMPLPRCQTVIMSPGIRREYPIYQAAQAALLPGGELISELEFALRHLNCRFAAITGTNGKTTTTEITTALLKANGLKAESSGNIGTALSQCAMAALYQELDFLVIETSSFQLENMTRFPACPAAILNLASDHIDRHGSMDAYAALKFKLFTEDRPAEQRIINTALYPWLKKFLPGVPVTTFSTVDPAADFTWDGKSILFRSRKIYELSAGHLRGIHNVENIMAALALLRSICGEESLFRPETHAALTEFRCSPHRMEVFAQQNGITFVNDSKATNPHAVNAAVRQFANGRNLLLILGGLDKGMDFSELACSFPYIRKAFLIGRCKDRIEQILHDQVPYQVETSFADAVHAACNMAQPGDCVMLSPATASMDMFKDYAERGDIFKQLVRQYLTENK